jgi:small-conductance mechanosensitive channel/CRP-like cAMP-binding protein
MPSFLFDSVLLRLGQTSIQLGDLLITLLVLLLILLGFRPFKRGLKFLLKLLRLRPGAQEAAGNLLAYGVLLVIVFAYLHWLGINLTSLTVFASVIGLGIGLGLQKLVNNFFSGLLLLLEQPIQVGDFIDLEGLKGVVESISVRFTVLRTMDNYRILIPNSELTEKRLINYDYGDRRCRLRLPIQVAHGMPSARVTEALLAAARQEPELLKTPRPEVFLEGVEATHLRFILSGWVTSAENLYRIRSNLHYLITETFERYQISFPLTEMQVELRRPTAKTESSQEDLSELLRRLDVFSSCTQAQLTRLIELGSTCQWPAQELICRRGEPGKAMYLILKGQVEVLTADETTPLATLGNGQFFGEMALLLGIPRTASVRAVEACELFVIEEGDVQTLLTQWPSLQERISQALKLRETELRERGQMPELPQNRSLVQQFRERLRQWLAAAAS